MMTTAGRVSLLAATLVSDGIDLVVIGGTARALSGAAHHPADLDVAVHGARDNLVRLVETLRRLGAQPATPPLTPEVLMRRSPCRVVTSFGPVDVFVRASLPTDTATEVLGGIAVGVAPWAPAAPGNVDDEEEVV